MSIIEVMVAITLAALLLTLGMPSFITGMQNRQIRSAADALQNGLMVAKTEALRRNRTVLFHWRDGSGYTIGCSPSDNSTGSDGQVNCPDTLQVREATEGSQNARVSPSEVQASGAPAGTAIFTGDLIFTPLGRVTTPLTVPALATLGDGNTAIYLVDNPAAGTCVTAGGEMRCLSIRITTGGQIRMCDPAVSTTAVPKDPRAC
jgi:type IV fimbrial biogenesis protein FimT